MVDFFRRLFETGEFMPHGHCYWWQPEVLWLHVVSDLLIAMAYYSIPLALVALVRRRRDLAFRRVFILFGAFIFTCGTTHLVDVIAVWTPIYRFEGVVKAATALVSVATAVILWPLLPRAVALPSPAQLRAEIERRKGLEDELRVLNVSLEERVRERTEALSEANRELSEKNRELDEFNYVASHDLKEPLRTLRVYGDMLRADLGEDLPAEAKVDLDVISRAAHRMQRLIDDLLALSRMGRQVETDRVELERIVDDVLEGLAPRIEEAGAEVTRDPLPAARADPTLVAAVYQNLIQNALKFRDRRAPRIHLGAAKDEAGALLLTVKDNGIGIPGDKLEVIFRPCKRLHSVKRYEGSGLGLAIVRRAVARVGGRVWAESVEGEGSTFSFTLPAAEVAR